jgi:hypothetical protein
MKRILLLPTLVAAVQALAAAVLLLASAVLFLPSCANQSSAATPGPGDNGNGSLAYIIDGTKTVVKPPSSIYINESSHDAVKGTVKIKVTIFPVGELFDFVVADKGTTNVVNYKPSFEESKVEATYMSGKGINYYGDHVSIAITALDAGHVAGTFSGTFASEGKSVTITDGSFDLPMRPKQ